LYDNQVNPNNLKYIQEPLKLRFITSYSYRYTNSSAFSGLDGEKYCIWDNTFPYKKICRWIEIDNSIFDKYQIEAPQYIFIDNNRTKISSLAQHLLTSDRFEDHMWESKSIDKEDIVKDKILNFDILKKVINNGGLIVYSPSKSNYAQKVFVFKIDKETSLKKMNESLEMCNIEIAKLKDAAIKKIILLIPLSILSIIFIIGLYFLNRYFEQKYYLIDSSIDTNTPLSRVEKLKVVIGFVFGILSFPLITDDVWLLIPLPLLLLSFYLLKTDKRSESKKYFNYYLGLINIGILLILLYEYISLDYFNYNDYLWREIKVIYIYVVIYAGIIISRYLFISLLYKPLLSHNEWINKNGIFSKKNENSPKKNKNSFNFIKRDNLSPFSVSDELLKWNELYEKGIISKEEFEKRKEKLLNE
jgi:hypothetical protein